MLDQGPRRFSEPARSLVRTCGAAAFLIGAVWLAYANSLRGPFVFDDLHSITENPTIRQLGNAMWSPPGGLTVSGRPVLNVSLALNYAFGGTSVTGYHVVNVLIHVAATLVLFGLVRLVLRLIAHRDSRNSLAAEAAEETWLAFAVALAWALHPLQTESVTYVVQRAESLMGLFYLGTLAAFARSVGVDSKRASRRWRGISIVVCGIGMATKEVMVTAPLVVLLMDRVLVAGSFRKAWRSRRGYYLLLASTWLVLGGLAWQNGDRGGTAGFTIGISPWAYALTQCHAIVHYVRLSLWPHPLVFDYGQFTAPEFFRLAPSVVLLVALIAGSLWLWQRRPVAGLAAAFFFLTLAPTSSIVPIVTEPIAEHRMYLPLLGVIAIVALALERIHRRGTIIALLGLTIGCGFITARRNETYRTERTLWATTTAQRPENPRAHCSLAWTLMADGDLTAAEQHFKTALALQPKYRDAQNGLASTLTEAGRLPEAAALYEAMLRDTPESFIAHHGFATVLFQLGRLPESAQHFEAAIRADPNSPAAHNNLGCVLYQLRDYTRAAAEHETALQLKPDYAEAFYNLGNVQAQQRDWLRARENYERAIRLVPDYVEAHANLGVVLQSLGEPARAAEEYRAALQLRPDYDLPRRNLEALLRNTPLR